jgi:hypothetical protein
MRIAIVACLVVTLLPSCIYSSKNLEQDRAVGYKNYPASIEAERERRRSRRKWALIGGPIEIVGGAALAALALYAPVTDDMDPDDGVVDDLGDAGKELAGRLLLASIGLAAVGSGVGDIFLGATDPAFGSPLIRDGVLVPADRIDHIPPQRTPRIAVFTSSMIGSRSLGPELGVGLFHWVSPRVRLTYAAVGSLGLRWAGDHAQIGGVGGDITAELAFGREHAGLYPKRAIGLFAGSGWVRTDGVDYPSIAGGLQFRPRALGAFRIGTSYVPGLDRYPAIEFTVRVDLRND